MHFADYDCLTQRTDITQRKREHECQMYQELEPTHLLRSQSLSKKLQLVHSPI